MSPRNLKRIEGMTDAAIKAAGWLTGTLKKQILDARKGSRAKIKSHEEAGKLPGAQKKMGQKGKTGKSIDYRASGHPGTIKVVNKAGGGRMSHQGLYPAEEARSGTMSEKKRAKNMKKGGQVKKKEQGYTDRKDESIAMRVKKKRTKKQLKDSANESYGKFGSAAKKSGKINRSASTGWDGNREVSRHYDS